MSAINWTQTPTIYELTLPTGNSYYIKDDEVRQWIGDGTTSGAEKRLSDAESAITALSNATHWLGITTTALTDGANTNPITINEQSVTAKGGDIVQDTSGTEFIFSDKVSPNAWQQFGASIGTLKAFAFVDTGTVTLTPAGSNSSSSVSGTCSVTPSGSNASSAVSGTCAVTPSGSISKGTGTANYTPEGSVSAPTISVSSAGATAKVTGITNVGSMPTYTVENEILTITAGATPTADTEKTFKTGDASYSASAPTFTGTGAELKFTGSESSGTISGTAEAQTFTGSASSGTISGTAQAQTFTGTEASHTVYPAT